MSFGGRETWGRTFSIVSIKTWASSIRRCFTISILSRSEKIDVIRDTRSCMPRSRLINCFQAGGSLHMRKRLGQRVSNHRKETKTHAPRKIANTSEASGRKRRSWSQQRCINLHNSSAKVGCVGRGGRLPAIIANMAPAAGILLNGTALVNTYIDMK